MGSEGWYDAARIANFGRDMSKSYTRLLRDQYKLAIEINTALEEGISPTKIAHDVMGRCIDHEARVNLMSMLVAMAQTEKIPESVVEPFTKGIRPRRV